jgi:uncharacterized membrane protein/GNAT superfamily N-acetyltransferase
VDVMVIRDATDEDAESLGALLETLGYPTDVAAVRARLDALRAADPAGRVIVAVAADQIVGFATLHTTPVLHRPTAVGRITGIAVQPAFQGGGIGGQLLRAAEEYFRGMGLGRIEVTSGPMHAPAHLFYRRHGYVDQGVRFAKTLAVLLAFVLTSACRAAEPPPPPGPLPAPASPPANFDPWQNARERGIDFRAVGQEPGWYVEVDHERGIRLNFDYGESMVVVSTPVQPGTRDGTQIYEGADGDHRMEVAIEATACKDAMSGADYPSTVTVNIDGRALRGCGRPLN